MKRLDGKVCIVTGAASGIGRASAVMLAGLGARVVAADLREDPSLVEEIGGEDYCRKDTPQALRQTGRCGGSRLFSCIRFFQLHHRCEYGCERRIGDGLKAAAAGIGVAAVKYLPVPQR